MAVLIELVAVRVGVEELVTTIVFGVLLRLLCFSFGVVHFVAERAPNLKY